MAASPVSVVARTPNAPSMSHPPARNGAFLQTLRSLAEKSPQAQHSTAGRPWPAESKSAEHPQALADARDRNAPATSAQQLEAVRPSRERDGDPATRPELSDDTCWDLLDPSWRALAALAPIERTAAPTPVSSCERVRSSSLEQLFGSLVKRVAWSTTSDRSSSTLRLEIGAGELAGATILITADLHELRVVLDTPPGVDLEAWKNRLSQRLASKGLAATFP